ncbi:MAG: catechol 1,2-dioxygenase [Acidimicrobiia bacterium]|jgi:3,4-dihydroxyphenylacetate 2,3-dioxygenase|nr:catechol 1,2-dioxygenase [Acidimicrobiia bacterium]
MGEVVGAALVAHVPTMVLPEATRKELNQGEEISLVPGLHQMKAERLDPLAADTFVVFDAHWATTVEFVVSAHERRSGRYTSDELPRGMCQMPYDFPGDPELAMAMADEVTAAGSWMTAIDDPYLPIHYPTVNLLPFLQGDERWVSVSIPQTGEPDDFLLAGAAIGQAIAAGDRRVVLLASGAMSHTFWKLKELRAHEASNPAHIRTAEARDADHRRIDWFRSGDHARVIDTMPEYLRYKPEAMFGHYLMMVAAVGGRDCRAPGIPYSDYENSIGTGQIHMWFDI